MNPEFANRLQLGHRLDTLCDDFGTEIGKDSDDLRDDALAILIAIDAANERPIELDDRRPQIDHALHVRMARTEIVNDEMSTGALANLAQHIHAEFEMREGSGFRHFEVDLFAMESHRIVGPYQPAGAELVRVDVHEKPSVITTRERDLTDDAAEVAARLLLRRRVE